MGDNVTNGSATSSKRSQSAQLRVRRDSLFSSESTEPVRDCHNIFLVIQQIYIVSKSALIVF